MSVSINSAEQAGKSDFPLLQCFAMTPYSAQVQRHFLLLGGREGVLLSASFSAREPTLTLVNPAEISEQESKGQPAEGGFPRPSPIITKLSSSLPAISSSSNSSPHPTSPAAHLSELYAKSSTQHAAPPVTRVKPSVMSLGSFHGSPYQPEPLVDLVMQDLRHQSPSSPQQNSKLLNSGVNIHARIAAGAGAGCDQLDEERCIKKTVSEDDVTQSELSHIMHYYDHLIGDGSRDQQRTTESDADNAHIPPRSDSGAHFSSEVPQGSHQANQQSHSISSGGGGVGGAERALTADSKGSTAEFATIVGSSSLDPQFWQAAQDAKSTYSFRRIKLNSSGNFNNSGNQSSKAGVRSPRKQYQLAPDFTRDVAPAHNQPHTPATITLEQQLQQLQRYSNQQLVPSVSQSFDQGSVISFASASRSRKGRGAYVSVSERAESYARIAKLKRSAQQQGADSRPSTTLTGIRAKSYSSSKSAEAAATSDVQQSVTAYQKGINTLRPL